MSKNLVYDIHDKPKFGNMIVFAIQQLLAIMAATITVPMMVGNDMSISAALFGAGVGTIFISFSQSSAAPYFSARPLLS